MIPLRPRIEEVRLAVLFLSRLPAGRLATPAPSIGASSWAWPLVGALVGALLAVVFGAALAIGLPPLLAAMLALVAGTLATGGLHEDGLADLADGFGGGATKARKLEIMRDSRIGSYGVLALILVMGLRAGGLIGAAQPALALIALGAASRAGLPLALHFMPAARGDGLGHAAMQVGLPRALVALVIAGGALLLMGPLVALITAAAIAAAQAALAALARRQIGGLTGDVAGAMQQVGEVAGWLTLAALA